MNTSNTNSSNIRTRFAPSPTGWLHIGSARTALFNYLFAKAQGGKFILRIEDTDQKRSTPQATKQVLESMQWMGLLWDEGPNKENKQIGSFYQSQRLSIYNQYLEKLLKDKKVYRCFCSDEELAQKKKRSESMGIPYVYDRHCRNFSNKEIEERQSKSKPYTYRFIVNTNDTITFKDISRGIIQFDSKLIGDFIIRKADGYPTYNFAVVVDDALMNITHIIRGDDHISNTPRQLLIYKALNFKIPEFCHIPMILGSDREKLSKRHGADDVLEYKKMGYLREPLMNFIALLGWTPSNGVEIIPWTLLIKALKKLKFSKSPAIFEMNKLNFLNANYIRTAELSQILPHFESHLQQGKYKDHPIIKNIQKKSGILYERCLQIIDITRGYCQFPADINDHLAVFLIDDFTIQTHLLTYFESSTKTLLQTGIDFFKKFQGDMEISISDEEFKSYQKMAYKKGFKGKSFFKPLRVALSGIEQGTELNLLVVSLSRASILKRLEKAIQYCKE